MKKVYPSSSHANAYVDIERSLALYGFSKMQNGMFVGGRGVNAVICVMTAIDLKATHPWFAQSVRDLRMLRIEENSDLKAALMDDD